MSLSKGLRKRTCTTTFTLKLSINDLLSWENGFAQSVAELPKQINKYKKKISCKVEKGGQIFKCDMKRACEYIGIIKVSQSLNLLHFAHRLLGQLQTKIVSC